MSQCNCAGSPRSRRFFPVKFQFGRAWNLGGLFPRFLGSLPGRSLKPPINLAINDPENPFFQTSISRCCAGYTASARILILNIRHALNIRAGLYKRPSYNDLKFWKSKFQKPPQKAPNCPISNCPITAPKQTKPHSISRISLLIIRNLTAAPAPLPRCRWGRCKS